MSLARIIGSSSENETMPEPMPHAESEMHSSECLELLRTIAADLHCIKSMLCEQHNPGTETEDSESEVITFNERR